MSHLILAAVDPMGVLLVVVGLGGLIFFHELGHFLACRVTGTRVEVFSVGFGPQVFGWRRGATLYKIGAIPLGGYVKMAGEVPGEGTTGAPDELPSKGFGARMLIYTAGVVFNVILAFILFGVAFGLGVPFLTSEVGRVEQGGAAWESGVQPGDVVTHVDGREIFTFGDLRTEVAFSDTGETLRLTVERDGRTLEIPVTPRYSEEAGLPLIGILPAFRREASAVQPESPIAKAGGQAGDVVVAVDGQPVERTEQLLERLAELVQSLPDGADRLTTRLTVSREGAVVELDVTAPVETVPQIGVRPYTPPVVEAVREGSPAAKLVQPGDRILSINGHEVHDLEIFRDHAPEGPLESLRFRRSGEERELSGPAGMTVRSFLESIAGRTDMGSTRIAPRPGMPAERAGVPFGAKVLAVAGKPVESWEEMREQVSSQGAGRLELTIATDVGTETLAVETVERPVPSSPLGYEYEPREIVHRETSLLGTIRTGWRRTQLTIEGVVLTLRNLLTQRISARHVGGPIELARTTYAMYSTGFARYLYILALISINLAILNILPIPVLDGGQCVLLVIEKLKGRPLSERAVGLYQLVGLVLILGLVVLAFHNDIRRLLE